MSFNLPLCITAEASPHRALQHRRDDITSHGWRMCSTSPESLAILRVEPRSPMLFKRAGMEIHRKRSSGTTQPAAEAHARQPDPAFSNDVLAVTPVSGDDSALFFSIGDPLLSPPSVSSPPAAAAGALAMPAPVPVRRPLKRKRVESTSPDPADVVSSMLVNSPPDPQNTAQRRSPRMAGAPSHQGVAPPPTKRSRVQSDAPSLESGVSAEDPDGSRSAQALAAFLNDGSRDGERKASFQMRCRLASPPHRSHEERVLVFRGVVCMWKVNQALAEAFGLNDKARGHTSSYSHKYDTGRTRLGSHFLVSRGASRSVLVACKKSARQVAAGRAHLDEKAVRVHQLFRGAPGRSGVSPDPLDRAMKVRLVIPATDLDDNDQDVAIDIKLDGVEPARRRRAGGKAAVHIPLPRIVGGIGIDKAETMRVNDVYRGKRRKPRLLSPAESKGLAPNAASDRYYEIYTRPLFHKDGREFSAAA